MQLRKQTQTSRITLLTGSQQWSRRRILPVLCVGLCNFSSCPRDDTSCIRNGQTRSDTGGLVTLGCLKINSYLMLNNSGKLDVLECVQGPRVVYKGVSQLFHYITFITEYFTSLKFFLFRVILKIWFLSISFRKCDIEVTRFFRGSHYI